MTTNSDLYSLVTKVVMLEESKNNLYQQSETEKKALSYVCQRPIQIWQGEPLVHHEVAKTPDLDKQC